MYPGWFGAGTKAMFGAADALQSTNFTQILRGRFMSKDEAILTMCIKSKGIGEVARLASDLALACDGARTGLGQVTSPTRLCM